ncbi:exodeoxyribonuclease I [Imhoffiella purpurea]|uniref:Exodeoxyribonuclease I n=1 Tax=Imhoffiella purpurea TaxID=1249627 RepID=W9V2H8_9GAMM|nr:exodeoxyribonuclease I [Imhoffiella purpurea]EXJ13708.1 Exodeoxyribonuclease I [Imhoffiella purpurea]
MAQSFYWHDYETWGSDPQRDRACQFAGLRTDLDLVEVGAPLVLYARPATDILPHPDACLITGITPQHAEREGVCEAEFAAAIHAVLGEPGTCGVGYNSMRFDDEITRNLLYRNLFDPYAREWRNGNSRWDLIDLLRLAQALRPDGIHWPRHDDGTPSFKLEHLTGANAIPHTGAHDALADVRATLGMARLLRRTQPKLFDYGLTLRDKRRVREMLDRRQPLIHASARYPAALGCIAPVLALASRPGNPNGVIAFDLRADPRQLLDLSEDEIRGRLFTPAAELPEGVERVPLKTIHVNRAPVLAPMKTLGSDAAERWRIDPHLVVERVRFLAGYADEIRSKVEAVHRPPEDSGTRDPDLMIYSGGFFSDRDRRTLDWLRSLAPVELSGESPRFEDGRLREMLFRYRARNWPETLSPEEREDWDAYRFERLTDPDGGGSIQVDGYQARLAELWETVGEDPAKAPVLEALSDWAERVLDADL